MNQELQSRIQDVITTTTDPWLDRPIGEVGWAVDVAGSDTDAIRVRVTVGYPLQRSAKALKQALEANLRAVIGPSSRAEIVIDWVIERQPVQKSLTPLSGIKNVIAVASAKGGVGKSTVAANMALALNREGSRVGLLDADIYGPSQPRMMGLSGRPETRDGKIIQPLIGYGIKVMSAGFLVEQDTPMIWRGPMVTQALVQLLEDTDWGEIDYLVVDMPPGTGDIQLTLAQRIPVAGAVIVTTPQQIAVLDARKGIRMFQRVSVPVLGIVENMAGFRCPHCGELTEIFSRGGGAELAAEEDLAVLGRIPLDPVIQQQSDGGRPTVISDPDSEMAANYTEAAIRMAATLSTQDRGGRAGPRIVME